jgi:hypothetical protein
MRSMARKRPGPVLKLKVICAGLTGLRFRDPYADEPTVKEPVCLGI